MRGMRKNSGFTLLQLSILLGVASIILAASLPGGTKGSLDKKHQAYVEQVQRIEEKMRAYMLAKSHRPCPASAELAQSHADFGLEGTNDGSCVDGATRKANLGASNSVVAGMVPVVTLKMDRRDAYDPWGNRILYVVDQRATQKGASFGQCSAPGFASGNIVVKSGTAGKLLEQAMVLYVSHGQDAHGAFPPNGSTVAGRINTGNTDTDSLDNASVDGDFAVDFDNIFIRKDKTATFDDLAMNIPELSNKCCLGALCPMNFEPTQIAGLVLWLDFADSSTTFQDDSRTTPASSDGDPVGGVTDKSGQNNHFTQATGTNKPTLRTNAVNGLKALEFDGTDDWLQATSAFTSLTAATVFIVIKADADPPPTTGQAGIWRIGGSTPYSSHYPYIAGGLEGIWDDFGSNTRKGTGTASISLAQWNVYSVGSRSGEWTSWLNGTQHYTTASNTVAWQATAANTRLGIGLTGTHHLDGRVAAMLIYDSFLDSDDRASVLTYLQMRYGTP